MVDFSWEFSFSTGFVLRSLNFTVVFAAVKIESICRTNRKVFYTHAYIRKRELEPYKDLMIQIRI